MKEILETKNIFVLDDTAFMRASLIKMLVDLGCRKEKIFQFENGQEALKALEQTAPHLIFSDWNMPQMSGLDFLRHIRSSDKEFRNVPVVMVTTVSEKDKVIEAIQYRLSGYIIKPVSADKVEKTLKLVFLEEDQDE